jgi:hypothetical protein
VRQHLSADLIAEGVKDLTKKLATSITYAMVRDLRSIRCALVTWRVAGGRSPRRSHRIKHSNHYIKRPDHYIKHREQSGELALQAYINVALTQHIGGGDQSPPIWLVASNRSFHYSQPVSETLQRLAPITSAFHNAANSPPECREGTRVDLLAEICNWLDDDSTACRRVLWLNGLAGTGKTTIARSVATAAEKRKMLAASFFFSRDHQERRRLVSIVPTIAYQLAFWRDELRYPISEAVSKNVNVADQLMTEQVDTLLIRSFEKNPLESKPSCALLILDALDECDKEKGTEGGDLLPLLIQSLDKIPFPVKIFVTSRPEHSISMMLNEPEL